MYDTTKPYKKYILEKIRKTWNNSHHIKVIDGIRRSLIKDSDYWKNFIEVKHTDGIGSKGLFHYNNHTFKEAVIDAFAMSLNDLSMVGANPYHITSNIKLENDDPKTISKIIDSLVSKCLEYKCIYTAGETAIIDTFKGLEIDLFVDAKLKEKRCSLLEQRLEPDLALIGIESNGIHSNGFTKIREILKESSNNIQDYIDQSNYETFFKLINEESKKSTFIYYSAIEDILSKYFHDIKAMQHITGGAFTKMKDLTDDYVDIIIDSLPPSQNVFIEINNNIKNDSTMYKTFNCGIGYIIFASRNINNIGSSIEKYFKSYIIGHTKPGYGKIIIKSQFDEKEVIL